MKTQYHHIHQTWGAMRSREQALSQALHTSAACSLCNIACRYLEKCS